MNTLLSFLFAGLFCLTFPADLRALTGMPDANWDRASALANIRQINTRTVLKPLYELVQTGTGSDLVDALSSIEQDSALPDPVKDFLLFTFAVGLGDLDEDMVNPEVVRFLAAYKIKTWVPHMDHPRMNVPLYNVGAATAGVRSRWARQKAAVEAQDLLEVQASRWISAYLEANHTERMGFADALEHASVEQLDDLGWEVLKQLGNEPELTLITAKAGRMSGDVELLRQVALMGDGPELSTALAIISPALGDTEAVELLHDVLSTGSTVQAALTIAHLGPGRLHDPALVNLLFDTLVDQNLGAAAALVLGSSRDPLIVDRLRVIASGKSDLSQQRARLAISTLHTDRGAER